MRFVQKIFIQIKQGDKKKKSQAKKLGIAIWCDYFTITLFFLINWIT